MAEDSSPTKPTESQESSQSSEPRISDPLTPTSISIYTNGAPSTPSHNSHPLTPSQSMRNIEASKQHELKHSESHLHSTSSSSLKHSESMYGRPSDAPPRISFLVNPTRVDRGGGLTREQLEVLEHVEKKAAIKGGRLRPGGDAGKVWGAERFYVLTEDGIFGYKSEAVEDLKRPLEVYWKAHFEQVVSTSPDSLSKEDRTSFAVIVDTQVKSANVNDDHVPTQKEKDTKDTAVWVYFSASSVEDAQDWKLALRSVLQLNKPRRLFDGHLWKKSNMLGRNAWKKKYFALYSDRRLVSYKRETDKNPRFDLALSDRSRVIGEGGSMDAKAKLPPVERAACFSVSTFSKSERGLLAPPALIHLAAVDVAEAVLWVRAIQDCVQYSSDTATARTKEEFEHEKARLEQEIVAFREKLAQERKTLEDLRESWRIQAEIEKRQLSQARDDLRKQFEGEIASMRKEIIRLETAKEEQARKQNEAFAKEKEALLSQKERNLTDTKNKLREEMLARQATVESMKKMEQAFADRAQQEQKTAEEVAALQQQRDELDRKRFELETKAKEEIASLKQAMKDLTAEKEQASPSKDVLEVLVARGRVLGKETESSSPYFNSLASMLVAAPSGDFKMEAAEDEYDPWGWDAPVVQETPHIPQLDQAVALGQELAEHIGALLKGDMSSSREGSYQVVNKTRLFKLAQHKDHEPAYRLHVDNEIYVSGLELSGNQLSKVEILTTMHLRPGPFSKPRWTKYASLNKVGFDPYKRKFNQDRCIEIPNFGDVENQALFGVFDGHGLQGETISQYVVEVLPPLLLAHPEVFSDFSLAVSSVLEDVHERVAKKMDTSTSGTTAILAFLQGDTLYTANLGDSRAILAVRTEEGKYVAQALSDDQAPDTPGEMERIIEAGGRVAGMTDMDGQEVGSKRVWLKGVNVPGLAMARSLGDDIAHGVGVLATPVVKQFKLDTNAAFMVVCSDGVTEFLDDQQIVDLVSSPYVLSPPEACRALVEKATALWNQNDAAATDDITAVVVFFD